MPKVTKLKIDGAWTFESDVFTDDRGFFREWFKPDFFKAETGVDFLPQQANLSQSDKGVLRGIHFSLAKAGQAKWITCTSGRILDVVVDIRPGSKTFRQWEAIELEATSTKSIFISSGLGHAFLSLEDKSAVTYLLSSPYSPKEEFEINPFDSEIGIDWPDLKFALSKKDAAAPSLSEFLAGLTPSARPD